MIFHENRLLADESHVISYLIFCRKLGKMSKDLSSVAVVIGALKVNIIVSNNLDTDRARSGSKLFTKVISK